MIRRPAVTAVLLCAALGLTACAGGPSDGAAAVGPSTVGGTTYPLTIDNCGYRQTFTTRPQRVAVLYGASVGEVESLLVLDLQDTVTANTQQYGGASDDPTMARRIAALPTGGLTLNQNYGTPAEQLIAARPDLVVSTWSGDFDAASGFATREELDRLGIRTLVNPVNCSSGNPRATEAEKRIHAAASIEDSYRFLDLLGSVFGAQDKARAVIDASRARIGAVGARVAGQARPTALIAYPGMSMMNTNGLPGVMIGGVFDDVLAKAGTRNVFEGQPETLAASLSVEQLATTNVDVLVLGAYTASDDLDAAAAALFRQFPQWEAAKNRRYVKVVESVYLGPLNATAVEKIAAVAHPVGP